MYHDLGSADKKQRVPPSIKASMNRTNTSCGICRWRWVLILLAGGLYSCGSTPTPAVNVDVIEPPDTSSTNDGSVTDSGSDSGPNTDAGNDSQSDAGIDSQSDTAEDSQSDTSSDTITEPDPGSDTAVPACGNGICEPEESSISCPADCGQDCGDGTCNGEESTTNCPADCGSLCGDGVCNGTETSEICSDDCGSEPVDCPLVEPPPPVSNNPLAETVQGNSHTTTVNGFTDDYITNADGSFKVGIRRDWGGTIIFFGFSGDGPGVNTTNVIDAHDTGREVQVAFYDQDKAMQGCAYNGSCQSSPGCPGQITFLGWNPVQGGNECNQGSGVEWVNATDGILSMETNPLFWNPDWQQESCVNEACNSPATSALPSDVLYTQRLRFVSSHVVEIDMTVTNLGGEEYYNYHEFPTLYASFGHEGTPNLSAILNSSGSPVDITGLDGNGFNYSDFTSPGGWATLQNETHSYGVGLYYENRLPNFRAYWKAGVFNNFRLMFPFLIPAYGSVRARAYLILGNFETVSGLANNLDNTIPPFGSLDSPAADAMLSGSSAEIKGWVLDNKDVENVEVLVDGEFLTTLNIDQSRPDACTLYPGYAMCDSNTVGFEGTISLQGLTPCAHILSIRATDTDGNARIIGRHRIYLGQ